MIIISTERRSSNRESGIRRYALLRGSLQSPGPVAPARDRRSKLITGTKLITTEDVLVELLNFFSEYGEKARCGAVTQAEGILSNSNIEVAAQSHESFIAGLTLYKARPDKGYSLTDCISMHAMRERRISDILTHDDHFRQEGFILLL